MVVASLDTIFQSQNVISSIPIPRHDPWDTMLAGGTFIVQLPDCLTTFTASMLYLLMRSFSGLSLVKPFTSCACDSSRFLVCFGRLQDDKVGALWLSEVRAPCKSTFSLPGGGGGGVVAPGLPQFCHACVTQLQ